MINGFKGRYPCTWVVWEWEVCKADTFCFLALAASTFSLQNDILAGSFLSFKDKYTCNAILSWKSLSHAETSQDQLTIQEVWDTVASTAVCDDILTRCPGDAVQARLKAYNNSNNNNNNNNMSDVDKVRLKAACAPSPSPTHTLEIGCKTHSYPR